MDEKGAAPAAAGPASAGAGVSATAGADNGRIIYTAEQIEVPPLLPALLKKYVKEVIRFNPPNIEVFSRDYWIAACNKDLDKFLESQAAAKKQAEARVD